MDMKSHEVDRKPTAEEFLTRPKACFLVAFHILKVPKSEPLTGSPGDVVKRGLMRRVCPGRQI